MPERVSSGDSHYAIAAFETAMEGFGPFESRPHFVVACSGGADSLSLTVLLHEWVGRNGGKVTALTVDHGLREEARAEAEATGRTLALLGIGHKILTWIGPKPASGFQAAARDARYRLLFDWCGENAALHLFLGHQALDQAETLVLRQRKGSGESGQSAMPAVRVLPNLRLLRPLLAANPEDLKVFLSDRGMSWVEDPSNRDRRFTRVRVREELLARSRRRKADLTDSARQFGAARDHAERELAARFARFCRLDPIGWLQVERGLFQGVSDARAKALLARALMTVGGAIYPPRGRPLAGLLEQVNTGHAFRRTLGGCQIIGRSDDLLIFRELALVASEPVTQERFLWDGRFLLSFAAKSYQWKPDDETAFHVAALGNTGWKGLCDANAEEVLRGHPHPARLAVPALWQGGELAAVPLIGWYCANWPQVLSIKCRFRPTFPLSVGGFTVVQDKRHII